MYEEHGIDYTQKGIVFSDALDYTKAIELQAQCQQLGFTKCTSPPFSRTAFIGLTWIFFPAYLGSFGIGTSLTNDFKTKSSGYKEQSKALNIVIKLGSVDGKECVKISDDITKVGAAIKLQFS